MFCAQVLVGKRAVERDHVACRREGHGQRQAVVLRVCQRMVDPGHHVQVQLGDLLLDILAVVERHVLEGEARRGRDAVEHVDGGARHLPGARVDGAHGSTVGKQPYAQRARVLDAGALGVAEFEHRPVFREIVREQVGGERGLALFDAVKHQVEVVRKARGLRGGEVEGPGREAQDGAEPVGNRHAHAQPHVGLSFFQRLEDLESAFARHQLVGKIHERGVGLEVGQAKDRVLPSGDPQGVDPVDGRGAYAVFADRSEQHRVGVPVAVDRVVEQLLQVLGVAHGAQNVDAPRHQVVERSRDLLVVGALVVDVLEFPAGVLGHFLQVVVGVSRTRPVFCDLREAGLHGKAHPHHALLGRSRRVRGAFAGRLRGGASKGQEKQRDGAGENRTDKRPPAPSPCGRHVFLMRRVAAMVLHRAPSAVRNCNCEKNRNDYTGKTGEARRGGKLQKLCRGGGCRWCLSLHGGEGGAHGWGGGHRPVRRRLRFMERCVLPR